MKFHAKAYVQESGASVLFLFVLNDRCFHIAVEFPPFGARLIITRPTGKGE